MFNKGKAFLLSILGSILLMAFFVILEILFPIKISTSIGWHSTWILVLIWVIKKHWKNEDYKEIRKTLWIDLGIYVLFPPIGAQKSIYDLQKLKAQKEGLNTTSGTIFCVFACLLYILYMLFYVALIFFLVISAINPAFFQDLPEKVATTKFEKSRDTLHSKCLEAIKDKSAIENKTEFCQCVVESLKNSILQQVKDNVAQEEQFDSKVWLEKTILNVKEQCGRFVIEKDKEAEIWDSLR